MADYRIIDFGDHLALHEVYFAPGGAITGRSEKPWAFVAPVGDARRIRLELRDALDCARSQPVLTAAEHPMLAAGA